MVEYENIENILERPFSPDSYDNIIVQHTIAIGLFRDYLTQIVDFLQANPTEIVTIIDEGDQGSFGTRAYFLSKVAEVYADVMGGTADQPGKGNLFVYQPGGNSPSNPQWPTLQQLIDTNQRLIVFMTAVQGEHKKDGKAWMLPAYAPDGFISSNEYNPPTGGEADEGYYQASGRYKSERWPAEGQPGLYLVNHYFSDKVAVRDESSRAYNDLTVGSLLVVDTLSNWKSAGVQPSFVNVDFYQGVRLNYSYLMPLVHSMNAYRSVSGVAEDLVQYIPELQQFISGSD
jgi:hypothetical protein